MVWDVKGYCPVANSKGLKFDIALDLKPNYVCTWANMGIGYANPGMYNNVRYLGDIGETDVHLFERILAHRTRDRFMHMEKSTEGQS